MITARQEIFDNVVASANVAPTLQVNVLTNADAITQLQSEWNDLVEQSEQGVFFLRWRWVQLWWQMYAPANSHLYLLTCRNERGQLVGLAPLYLRRRAQLRELYALGTGIEIKTSEYLNLLARRGFESEVGNAFAQYLLQRRDWDRLSLWGAPATSIVLQHFRAALQGRETVTICDRTRHVDTNTDWETFKQSLGSATRKKVDYHCRRLLKTHECEFRRIEHPDELKPALDALIHLHQLRWESKGEPGSFTLPRFEEFFRTIAADSLQAGRLKLWTLMVDSKIVTAQLAFFDRGIAHVFQGGFDPAYSDYRIGNVIFWLCIKDCIESGDVRAFDFMGGGAAYKELWTKQGQDLIELELLQPGWRAVLYSVSKITQQGLRKIWRSVVPPSVREMKNNLTRRWHHRRQRANQRERKADIT